MFKANVTHLPLSIINLLKGDLVLDEKGTTYLEVETESLAISLAELSQSYYLLKKNLINLYYLLYFRGKIGLDQYQSLLIKLTEEI